MQMIRDVHTLDERLIFFLRLATVDPGNATNLDSWVAQGAVLFFTSRIISHRLIVACGSHLQIRNSTNSGTVELEPPPAAR
jgi:hypothetical protein